MKRRVVELTDEQRNKKIKKHKLDDKWNELNQSILALGFTQACADKIILRSSSAKTIEAVKTHINTLLSFNYTLADITSIASHRGGSKNLQAVSEKNAALQGLGFKSEQIVTIVSQNGGSKKLQSLKHK